MARRFLLLAAFCFASSEVFSQQIGIDNGTLFLIGADNDVVRVKPPVLDEPLFDRLFIEYYERHLAEDAKILEALRFSEAFEIRQQDEELQRRLLTKIALSRRASEGLLFLLARVFQEAADREMARDVAGQIAEMYLVLSRPSRFTPDAMMGETAEPLTVSETLARVDHLVATAGAFDAVGRSGLIDHFDRGEILSPSDLRSLVLEMARNAVPEGPVVETTAAYILSLIHAPPAEGKGFAVDFAAVDSKEVEIAEICGWIDLLAWLPTRTVLPTLMWGMKWDRPEIARASLGALMTKHSDELLVQIYEEIQMELATRADPALFRSAWGGLLSRPLDVDDAARRGIVVVNALLKNRSLLEGEKGELLGWFLEKSLEMKSLDHGFARLPLYVLAAFEGGADGETIAGWLGRNPRAVRALREMVLDGNHGRNDAVLRKGANYLRGVASSETALPECKTLALSTVPLLASRGLDPTTIDGIRIAAKGARRPPGKPLAEVFRGKEIRAYRFKTGKIRF